MTTPELARRADVKELQTKLPGVTMRELRAAEITDLRDLITKNHDHFVKGGITPEYELGVMVKDLLGDQQSTRRHIGVWLQDKLIGYVSVESDYKDYDEYNDLNVEISYAVDRDHVRNGIAEAAVQAITEEENENGHNVLAEVEGRNEASKRMLGKIGYEEARHSSNGREVFISHSMSDEALLQRIMF